MTGTITALFDSRDDAERAQGKLRDAGVTDVTLTAQGSGYGDDMTMGATGADATLTGSADPVRDVSEGDYGERGEKGHHGGGLWQSIKNFFSDEDRPTYEEGLRRGHTLLTAQVDEGMTDQATRMLEDCDAMDVNARAEEWRASGWTGMPAHDASVAGHVGDDRLTGHHGDDTLQGPSTDDEARLGENDTLTGEPRAFTSTDSTDAGYDSGRMDETDEERSRRLAMMPPTITPSI